MRKQIKAKLLDIMKDLTKTADELDGILEHMDVSASMDILTQMQELIMQSGAAIENSGDTGQDIVKKLEEACEWIYQISCSLEKPENRRVLSKELSKLCADAAKEIETLIPAGKEVLFLPYQVSMWDALESVWLAAKEEPDTECYVVPIPYYDVLSDGSLGKLHYEGWRYPDYVPVTHYKDYSIEERRPDIIFIHNPYDEFNRVTRIPEQYYTRNIKQYTDLLVYIPYFVCEEGGPADSKCQAPGVLYADRVVVQPGAVYEKYCRIYTEIRKKNGLENFLIPAEQKFLPLGSPKIDKLWNTKTEVEDLPQSWRRVVLKSDGSRKKIILYNLSINPLLKNREQTLGKLDNVFRFFKGKREECVLLWRPHPLLISTINAMIPWLRDAYLQRVRQFKEEGWGIYDETPDPNLAMALSDGYYGDESSLLTVYRETGKPILLQDVNILD